MEDGIPVVRLQNGTWHRSDRNRCVQSTGSTTTDADHVEPDDVVDLRPKCPYCFEN